MANFNKNRNPLTNRRTLTTGTTLTALTQTVTINQLLFVHAQLGNKTSKWNPLMKAFLFGSRHGVHFFDLKRVLPYLKRVIFFLEKATANHEVILFIGAHPLISVLVRFLALNTSQNSISRKWVAGTLTNWRKIKPYVQFLYNTTVSQIRKRFVLKTEKKIEQKIVQYLKMKYLLAGIERMPTVPNLVVLFEVDESGAPYPLLEANKLMIPVLSIVNSGPTGALGIAYPIFANNYLFESLFFFGNLMLQAIRNGIFAKRLFFLKSTANFVTLEKSKQKKKQLAKYISFLQLERDYKVSAMKRALRKILFFPKPRKYRKKRK